MEKYINAEKFLQAQRKRCAYCLPLIGTCSTDNVTLDSEIIKFPAADVVPVKHGKWIRATKTYPYYDYKCSFCGCEEYRHIDSKGKIKIMNYCPNCGARMDGDGR